MTAYVEDAGKPPDCLERQTPPSGGAITPEYYGAIADACGQGPRHADQGHRYLLTRGFSSAQGAT